MASLRHAPEARAHCRADGSGRPLESTGRNLACLDSRMLATPPSGKRCLNVPPRRGRRPAKPASVPQPHLLFPPPSATTCGSSAFSLSCPLSMPSGGHRWEVGKLSAGAAGPVPPRSARLLRPSGTPLSLPNRNAFLAVLGGRIARPPLFSLGYHTIVQHESGAAFSILLPGGRGSRVRPFAALSDLYFACFTGSRTTPPA